MRGSVDVTVRVSLGCHISVFTLIQHSLNMNIPRQKYPLTSGPRTSATTIRSPVLRDRYFHTGIISFTLPLYCSSYSSAANAVASARYCLNIFYAFTVKNHHDKSQTAFTYSLLLAVRAAELFQTIIFTRITARMQLHCRLSNISESCPSLTSWPLLAYTDRRCTIVSAAFKYDEPEFKT